MTECSASRPELQAGLTVLEPVVLRRQPINDTDDELKSEVHVRCFRKG